MSQKLGIVWNYLAHYKYLIVIIIGVLVVGFVDDNSVWQHVKYQIRIAELREEINKYQSQYGQDVKQLKEMRQGVKAYERIARERYFMKADDEDIFVLSTDLPDSDSNEQDNDYETTE